MSRERNVVWEALGQVVEGRLTLSREDARGVLEYLLEHREEAGAEVKAAALFGAMAARGETAAELAGFVDALRARTIALPLTDAERAGLVDTCGTGGDHSNTFNISTAAALVAAAAGATVAKHGNRAVTSACGSADVLEALGVRVEHTPGSAAESLRRHGFAFLAAPVFQPAMRTMLPLRRAMGIRTAFNLLGPLTNPAGAQAQVVGVYSLQAVGLVAETLALLGSRMAFVVHGSGMDELTIGGPTLVAQVIEGEVQVGTVTAEEFGLALSDPGALRGGTAAENATTLREIFGGERGARRDVVVMNAAAVLVTADLAGDFAEAARLAEATIDSGAVTKLVDALAGPS